MGTAAAIDDGPCGDPTSSSVFDKTPHLRRGTSCGDHILDDDERNRSRVREPSTPHGPLLAFAEEEGNAQGPGHLVADDETADGRREDDLRPVGGQMTGQGLPREGRIGRVTEQKGALKVIGTVQARCQTEMSLEMGTAPKKHFLKTFSFRQLRQDNPSSISSRIVFTAPRRSLAARMGLPTTI